METKAYKRHIRLTPRKLRLVVGLVRGLDVNTALEQLSVIPKKGADIVEQTLKSAIANARHNHQLRQEDLVIKKILVNEGRVLKRWRPVSRGMAHSFQRRQSHLEVVLGIKPGAKKLTAKEVKTKVKTKDVKQTVGQSKRVISKNKIQTSQVKVKEIKDPRREGNDRSQQHLDTVRQKTKGGGKAKMFRRKSI